MDATDLLTFAICLCACSDRLNVFVYTSFFKSSPIKAVETGTASSLNGESVNQESQGVRFQAHYRSTAHLDRSLRGMLTETPCLFAIHSHLPSPLRR